MFLLNKRLRTQEKKSYKEREGENITFTPILIEAIVKAIKDFPRATLALHQCVCLSWVVFLHKAKFRNFISINR